MGRMVRPYGPHARLIECDGEDPAAVSLAIRALAVPGVVDVVTGAHTVVVECLTSDAAATLDRRLGDLETPAAATELTAARIEVPVRFDGADLSAVATAAGWSNEELIGRLTAIDLTVAFCGFSPGFAYLRGLPPALHLPRRSTPRPEVPAGSVAIAAGFAAVYPAPSPGGWHLLGRTDLAVW